MRPSLLLTLAFASLALAAAEATAQISADAWYLTPQFGLSASSELSSGVSFGLVSEYMISGHWGLGPFGEFTTAGRQWETGEDDEEERKTEASNTIIVGGRFSYHLTEFSDTTWRLHFGAGWMRMSSIDSFKDGTLIAFDGPAPGFDPEPGEITAINHFAGTFGIGTFLPMSDRSRIALDLNVYASTLGDRTARTQRGAEIDLNDRLDGGMFWLTTINIGFHLSR